MFYLLGLCWFCLCLGVVVEYGEVSVFGGMCVVLFWNMGRKSKEMKYGLCCFFVFWLFYDWGGVGIRVGWLCYRRCFVRRG